MEQHLIGLRTQDFHEALKNTTSFGPKEVYYEKTLLIGKAATVAMHLRGLLYIPDYTQLKFAAASLGISGLELQAVLRELEEVDFVSVVKDGENIRRIDVRVPEFRSGYEDLGERWQLLEPSEIEVASINTLNSLYRGPVSQEAFLKSLGLDTTQESIMLDVMKTGILLSSQTIDGQPLLYTPLAVDSNPALYLQWAKRFPAEVAQALETLRNNQGLPVVDPVLMGNPALDDAVATGVLMPVTVNGVTGSQRFVFAPHGNLSQEENVIMDKARALVSCVRYGQRFAAGRPIINPRWILESLKSNKKFKRGHPDLETQYGLLVEKFIGHPVDEGNGRWNFHIDDTDENMRAIDVALEMLEHGDTTSARINIDAQKALLSTSGYQGPVSTRMRMAENIQSSPRTRSEIIKQMGNLMRGVSSDV